MKKTETDLSNSNKITWFRASLPFLLVLAMGITSITSILYLKDRNKWVLHTDAVIQHTVKIEKLVIDTETGLRGFLLTGQEQFLEPYNMANNKLDNMLINLETLVSDNPPQVKKAQIIKAMIIKWQKEVAIPEIKMRKKVVKGSIDAKYLEQLLSKGTGKNILDSIRNHMDKIDRKFKNSNDIKGRFLALRIAKDMVDMETGQRGFLVTGKEIFLEPFYQGQAQLDSHITSLYDYASIERDPWKIVKTIEAVRQESIYWIKKALNPEINARKEMNKNVVSMEDIISMVETQKGKRLMDKLRVQINEFIEVERKLHKERMGKARAVGVVYTGYTLVSCIISLLIGFFMLRNRP